MVESLDGETWRDIGVVDGVDMSGLYIVSDFGRIFMFERDYYRKDGVKVHAKEKFVPYHDNGTGYLYGCLFNDEISRKFIVFDGDNISAIVNDEKTAIKLSKFLVEILNEK